VDLCDIALSCLYACAGAGGGGGWVCVSEGRGRGERGGGRGSRDRETVGHSSHVFVYVCTCGAPREQVACNRRKCETPVFPRSGSKLSHALGSYPSPHSNVGVPHVQCQLPSPLPQFNLIAPEALTCNFFNTSSLLDSLRLGWNLQRKDKQCHSTMPSKTKPKTSPLKVLTSQNSHNPTG
jgi:hypothetical protein